MQPSSSRPTVFTALLGISWTLVATLVIVAVAAGLGFIDIRFALGGDILLGVTAIALSLLAAQQPRDPNERSH